MGRGVLTEASIQPRWYDYLHLACLVVLGAMLALAIPGAFFWFIAIQLAIPAWRRLGLLLLHTFDRAVGVPRDLLASLSW
jgi:hypothetical protein